LFQDRHRCPLEDELRDTVFRVDWGLSANVHSAPLNEAASTWIVSRRRDGTTWPLLSVAQWNSEVVKPQWNCENGNAGDEDHPHPDPETEIDTDSLSKSTSLWLKRSTMSGPR
jgi:hypothetical protein